MNLREELELLKAGNASLVKANEKLRKQVKELEVEYEALCYCCDAIREHRDRLNDQNAELSGRVKLLEGQLRTLDRDRLDLFNEINHLREQVEEVEPLRCDNEQLRERVEELKEEIDDYEGNDYFALYEAAKSEADDAIADRDRFYKTLRAFICGDRIDFDHNIAIDVLESMFHVVISDVYSNFLGDISIAGRKLR